VSDLLNKMKIRQACLEPRRRAQRHYFITF
jgi:hypothetical protein